MVETSQEDIFIRSHTEKRRVYVQITACKYSQFVRGGDRRVSRPQGPAFDIGAFELEQQARFSFSSILQPVAAVSCMIR